MEEGRERHWKMPIDGMLESHGIWSGFGKEGQGKACTMVCVVRAIEYVVPHKLKQKPQSNKSNQSTKIRIERSEGSELHN